MSGADRAKVALAGRLLAKAESTDSHEEAIALALRAYSTLAEWLSAAETAASGSRRRERRLLRDRRALRGGFGRAEARPDALGVDPTTRATTRRAPYEGVEHGPSEPGNIDLRL